MTKILDRIRRGDDSAAAELVKLRYFMGVVFEEAAVALDIALPPAKQWWTFARAWFSVDLRGPATR